VIYKYSLEAMFLKECKDFPNTTKLEG